MSGSSLGFSAGYQAGLVVRSLLNSFRAAVTIPSQLPCEFEVPDYEKLSTTPAMVRRDVDLAQWQAENLHELPQIPEDWDCDPSPGVLIPLHHAPSIKFGPLNDLI